MTTHGKNSLPKYRHAAAGSAVSGRHRTFLQPRQTFETSTNSAVSKPSSKGNVLERSVHFHGHGAAIIRVLRRVAHCERQRNKEKLQ